jgi:hypothetical protein
LCHGTDEPSFAEEVVLEAAGFAQIAGGERQPAQNVRR